jgi:radical SAM protein with 4Fe4S-binding SPASM domain
MSKKDPFFKTHLLEKSLQYAYKNCIPLVSTIELTHACNFKCSHCYNYDRQGPIPKETLDNLLSKEEVFTVIDDLATLGALYVNFTGGEATASPHLVEYIQRVRSHHMEARIKSNGALITQEMAKDLYEAGLAGADISLYGANNETYLEFTDSPNSFDKAIQGIDNLKKAGVDLHVSIILHRNNIDELEEMIQLCRDRQLLFQISIEVTDRYDSSQGARQNELTLDQYAQLLSGPYKEFFNSKNTDKAVQCSCARSVCGISCTGDVFPCIGAPIKSGNIKDKPLVEIWKSSNELNKIRDLKREDFKSCTSCEYIESCNRSSGSIYINTGDYTGCEETVYKQAKIKHEIS